MKKSTLDLYQFSTVAQTVFGVLPGLVLLALLLNTVVVQAEVIVSANAESLANPNAAYLEQIRSYNNIDANAFHVHRISGIPAAIAAGNQSGKPVIISDDGARLPNPNNCSQTGGAGTAFGVHPECVEEYVTEVLSRGEHYEHYSNSLAERGQQNLRVCEPSTFTESARQELDAIQRAGGGTPLTAGGSLSTNAQGQFLWNGSPVSLVGFSWYGVIASAQNDSNGGNACMAAYLDELRAHGVNFTRVWMIEQWTALGAAASTQQQYGHTVFQGSYDNRDYNLSQLNDTYIDKLRRFISLARQRGIAVQVTLFDRAGVKCDACTSVGSQGGSPYNRNNNQHNVLNLSGSGHQGLMAQSGLVADSNNMLIDRVRDELSDAGLANVILEIINEPLDYFGQAATRDWHFAVADRLKSSTPPPPVCVPGRHAELVEATWPKLDHCSIDPVTARLTLRNTGTEPWMIMSNPANPFHVLKAIDGNPYGLSDYYDVTPDQGLSVECMETATVIIPINAGSATSTESVRWQMARKHNPVNGPSSEDRFGPEIIQPALSTADLAGRILSFEISSNPLRCDATTSATVTIQNTGTQRWDNATGSQSIRVRPHPAAGNPLLPARNNHVLSLPVESCETEILPVDVDPADLENGDYFSTWAILNEPTGQTGERISDHHTIHFDIDCDNEPPPTTGYVDPLEPDCLDDAVANNDEISVVAGETTWIDVVENDHSTNGEPLQPLINTGQTSCPAVILDTEPDGTIRFQAPSDFAGECQIGYRYTNGETALVYVQVGEAATDVEVLLSIHHQDFTQPVMISNSEPVNLNFNYDESLGHFYQQQGPNSENCPNALINPGYLRAALSLVSDPANPVTPSEYVTSCWAETPGDGCTAENPDCHCQHLIDVDPFVLDTGIFERDQTSCDQIMVNGEPVVQMEVNGPWFIKVHMQTIDGPVERTVYLNKQSPAVAYPDPTSISTAIQRHNFADYDLGGQGKGYSDQTPGNDGTAVRVGGSQEDVDLIAVSTNGILVESKPGEWLQFTRRVEQAGTYGLRLHLSNPDSTPATIVMRQDDQILGEWQVPPGFDGPLDANPNTSSLAEYFLTSLMAGAQSRFRFEVTEGQRVVLNHFRFCDPAQPDCPTAVSSGIDYDLLAQYQSAASGQPLCMVTTLSPLMPTAQFELYYDEELGHFVNGFVGAAQSDTCDGANPSYLNIRLQFPFTATTPEDNGITACEISSSWDAPGSVPLRCDDELVLLNEDQRWVVQNTDEYERTGGRVRVPLEVHARKNETHTITVTLGRGRDAQGAIIEPDSRVIQFTKRVPEQQRHGSLNSNIENWHRFSLFNDGGFAVAYMDVDSEIEGTSQLRSPADVDVIGHDAIAAATTVDQVEDGEWLNYTFDNVTAGVYKVEVIARRKDSTGDAPYIVVYDVDSGRRTEDDLVVHSTTLTNIGSSEITLGANTRTLLFSFNGSAMEVESFRLTLQEQVPEDILRWTDSHPGDKFAAPGGPVEFTVQTAGGTPPVSYQWYRGPSIQQVGTNSNQLTIDQVEPGDEGSYFCVVTDAQSAVLTSESGFLNVLQLDEITVNDLEYHWRHQPASNSINIPITTVIEGNEPQSNDLGILRFLHIGEQIQVLQGGGSASRDQGGLTYTFGAEFINTGRAVLRYRFIPDPDVTSLYKEADIVILRQAPVAQNDRFELSAARVGQPVTLDIPKSALLFNDIGVDGQPHPLNAEVTLADGTHPAGAHGTIEALDEFIRYTLTSTTFAGSTSFTYHLTDDGARSIQPATVVLDVIAFPEAANDGPLLLVGSETTLIGTADVLGNDSGHGVLEIADSLSADHGIVQLTEYGIEYTPDLGYTGPDQIGYSVIDDLHDPLSNQLGMTDRTSAPSLIHLNVHQAPAAELGVEKLMTIIQNALDQ